MDLSTSLGASLALSQPHTHLESRNLPIGTMASHNLETLST